MRAVTAPKIFKTERKFVSKNINKFILFFYSYIRKILFLVYEYMVIIATALKISKENSPGIR